MAQKFKGSTFSHGGPRPASRRSRRHCRVPAATQDACCHGSCRFCDGWPRRRLPQVTEKAGRGQWYPHELRHSAASLLSAAGVPLEQVADVLGHASTRVTSQTYRHATTPTVEAGAEPMDRLLAM